MKAPDVDDDSPSTQSSISFVLAIIVLNGLTTNLYRRTLEDKKREIEANWLPSVRLCGMLWERYCASAWFS